ncbi:STAS domain-containing protein [Paenibacillus alginolyticus]|uniref:Anti-sigma factor antagonist n=1 Tax=Paenibacillus alginolyticus TaxID=59839 RepID=A0ABT4G9U2_9BACL|nr:STAS domain-containing protein [Paenibacillus alginolyticus]MCY9669889.1 STAS domain-containing protein [Paenibacillus alginolyticus]MCY9692933.1 STAS domain-containing protein [Paenibacillus alginolyticus]MEC0144326.1 STAS domain-containing protein [Paenibacillus alginolyticus]
MFNYETVKLEDKVVVKLEGDLDIEVTEIMEDEIATQLEGHGGVELDFSGVSFVDSSGIGLLISLVGSLKEKGAIIHITNLQEDVKLIFEMLQMTDILGSDVFV